MNLEQAFPSLKIVGFSGFPCCRFALPSYLLNSRDSTARKSHTWRQSKSDAIRLPRISLCSRIGGTHPFAFQSLCILWYPLHFVLQQRRYTPEGSQRVAKLACQDWLLWRAWEPRGSAFATNPRPRCV